jgi:hypothetical protein
MNRPPLPPFTLETATQKVRLAGSKKSGAAGRIGSRFASRVNGMMTAGIGFAVTATRIGNLTSGPHEVAIREHQ